MLQRIKKSNLTNVLKKYYKKLSYNYLFIIILVVTAASFYFFKSENSFYSNILDVSLPKIPERIIKDMNSQVYLSNRVNLTGYDWFSYYDPEYDTKVEVKLSGLSPSHFKTLGQPSFRIKFDKNDYRFKSLASEISQSSNDNQYELLSEVATYNVAKDFYKYTPDAGLARINNDNSEILIYWDEPYDNSIRENDFVSWTDLAKNYLYAKDSQERYFDMEWDTTNQTKKDLVKEFIKFMDPIYDAITKSPKDFKETNLDFENYSIYLALSTIFSSGHMDSHNLKFIPDIKKGEYTWNMGLNDLAGLKSFLETDILHVVNPVAQYYLRDPQRTQYFLSKVYQLNNSLLKGGRISQYYNEFSCNKIEKSNEFLSLLETSIYPNTRPMNFSKYCDLFNKVSGYEIIRSTHLDNLLSNATAHWWLTKEDDKEYLYINIPSPVGVHVDSITCGYKECRNDFKLLNKPWWQSKDDWSLIPELVRINGNWKSILQPSDFLYKYEYTDGSYLDEKDMNLSLTNSVTGKKAYPVKSIYPTFEVNISKGKKENTFNFELKPINPTNVEHKYSLAEYFTKTVESAEATPRDDLNTKWRIVLTSPCKESEVEDSLHHLFDCSGVNATKWPYPLPYKVDLYFQDYLIRDYYGEFYITYKPNVSKFEELSKDKLEQYLVPQEERENLLDELPEDMQKEELKYQVEHADHIYKLPEKSSVLQKDDLMLGNDDVLWISKGSILRIWPLSKLEVGTLVLNGDNENKVEIQKTSFGSWYELNLSHGGYFIDSIVRGGANKTGSIKLTDGELIALNSEFGNVSNITCTSCNIFMDHASFLGTGWGLSAKDSLLDLSNTYAKNASQMFIFEDSIGKISNTEAKSDDGVVRTDKIFNIIGPASDIEIDGAKVDNVNIFIAKQYRSKIRTKNISTTSVNDELLNLDDESIYDSLKTLDLSEVKKQFPFIDLEEDNTLHIQKGIYKVDRSLIVPENAKLILDPGVELEFSKDAGILSYGEIIAEGDQNDPITFMPQEKKWEIILLKGEKSKGSFKYTHFINGDDKFFPNQKYTGTLSADSSQYLNVEHSFFENSTGDDAINCKYTNCKIINNQFEKNHFDGVDFDFTSGVVAYNIFKDNGNDAIDVSFDNSIVYGNQVYKSGDKCISIGENSNTTVYNNLLSECQVGIEVKDNSKASIEYNDLIDNKLAVGTYQKKRAFGGGALAAMSNNKLKDNKENNQSDRFTSIVFEDYSTKERLNELEKLTGSERQYGIEN